MMTDFLLRCFVGGNSEQMICVSLIDGKIHDGISECVNGCDKVGLVAKHVHEIDNVVGDGMTGRCLLGWCWHLLLLATQSGFLDCGTVALLWCVMQGHKPDFVLLVRQEVRQDSVDHGSCGGPE